MGRDNRGQMQIRTAQIIPHATLVTANIGVASRAEEVPEKNSGQERSDLRSK